MTAFAQDIRFTHSADGTRLAYAANGRGFPLVRAAHWLTNIDRDWRTPVWRPWFDALGARYHFHRYDSRGCGLSDREATEASLDVLVADLEAVVDAAKLERFALLGISQGGAVSMAYAVRHPDRVSHLVLLGAFARGPLRRNPTPEELESIQAQMKLMEVGWGQDNPAAAPNSVHSGAWNNPARSALGTDDQAAFTRDILALLEQGNRSQDRTLVLPSEYLEVVIERR